MTLTIQPTEPKNWMIYGAYGYTGKLIAHEAVKRGLRPTIGGRDRIKTQQLANELGLPSVCFDLQDTVAVSKHLSDVSLILNCAGPFSLTAKPLIDACLKSGTHYLDITGEIDVFEWVQSLKAEALEANVVLCPGVGFDVIPTDCVAAMLKSQLPDATHLALGFDSKSTFSPGTAKTSIEGIAQGGKIRRGGQIITVPLAYKIREIDFGNNSKSAMTIPWGDISTAYYSTGIPNVEVYVPSSEKMIKTSKRANYIRPLLRTKWVQNLLKSYIGKRIKGPRESERASENAYVWGEATNAKGEKKTVRIVTSNGYDLTIQGSLAVVQHLLVLESIAGAYTPSKLMGTEFITQLAGSSSFHHDN
ncbi:saccharopine dehydrogenase family protein [Vibrio sp. V08_P9A1T1]|uniref:saccharopine dehydrogenase family protein n=1 Tax=Vibrio sp. V08_P9A1T1 TaxID=1938663 RepID=UPI001C3DEC7F|nr:saccharopine dehydrogenase NADP-binding domain-containing protein [Vibrio sp. V08_P9A1T1]